MADSEVSAVRRIDLKRKVVETAVGKELFVFGYKDGRLDEARLQHPLEVASEGNKIYVADTYNHAIKGLSTLSSSACQLWLASRR